VRAVVLVVFLAAHGILAKYLYAHPPPGVPETQAQAGGQLMYYGGDVLDLVLIAIFCWQWYTATAPARLARLVPSAR
jgi:putative membrane protein